MSATDELRRILDERGIEYETDDAQVSETEWYYVTKLRDGYRDRWTYEEPPDCDLLVSYQYDLGAEEAIAATVGRGTCWLHDCDGSFSSVNRPVWRCDCGAFMTQYTDATTYHKPRYCPNCGRRCVG